MTGAFSTQYLWLWKRTSSSSSATVMSSGFFTPALPASDSAQWIHDPGSPARPPLAEHAEEPLDLFVAREQRPPHRRRLERPNERRQMLAEDVVGALAGARQGQGRPEAEREGG